MLSNFPLGPGFLIFFFLAQAPEAVWTHTKIDQMQHVCWVMRQILHFAYMLAGPVEGTCSRRREAAAAVW